MQQIPKCESDKYKNSIKQICFWHAGYLFKTDSDFSWLASCRVPCYRWRWWWDDGGQWWFNPPHHFLRFPPHITSFQSSSMHWCSLCSLQTKCILSEGNVFYLHKQILFISDEKYKPMKANPQSKLFCRVGRRSYCFVFQWRASSQVLVVSTVDLNDPVNG